MIRKILIATAIVSSMAVTAPAMATGKKHNHSCGCGHIKCGSTSTSTTSGNTSTSGGHTSTSSGNTTWGNTSTSSGTKVPEPGTLGLLGAGLLGLGYATRRRRRSK